MSNWCENHTKVLQTHVFNFGVTEGELSVVFFHLLTAFLGQNYWIKPISENYPSYLVNLLNKLYIDSSQPSYFPIYIIFVFLSYSLALVVYLNTIYSIKNRLEASLQFIPIIYLLILGFFKGI